MGYQMADNNNIIATKQARTVKALGLFEERLVANPGITLNRPGPAAGVVFFAGLLIWRA